MGISKSIQKRWFFKGSKKRWFFKIKIVYQSQSLTRPLSIMTVIKKKNLCGWFLKYSSYNLYSSFSQLELGYVIENDEKIKQPDTVYKH